MSDSATSRSPTRRRVNRRSENDLSPDRAIVVTSHRRGVSGILSSPCPDDECIEPKASEATSQEHRPWLWTDLHRRQRTYRKRDIKMTTGVSADRVSRSSEKPSMADASRHGSHRWTLASSSLERDQSRRSCTDATATAAAVSMEMTGLQESTVGSTTIADPWSELSLDPSLQPLPMRNVTVHRAVLAGLDFGDNQSFALDLGPSPYGEPSKSNADAKNVVSEPYSGEPLALDPSEKRPNDKPIEKGQIYSRKHFEKRPSGRPAEKELPLLSHNPESITRERRQRALQSFRIPGSTAAPRLESMDHVDIPPIRSITTTLAPTRDQSDLLTSRFPTTSRRSPFPSDWSPPTRLSGSLSMSVPLRTQIPAQNLDRPVLPSIESTSPIPRRPTYGPTIPGPPWAPSLRAADPAPDAMLRTTRGLLERPHTSRLSLNTLRTPPKYGTSSGSPSESSSAKANTATNTTRDTYSKSDPDGDEMAHLIQSVNEVDISSPLSPLSPDSCSDDASSDGGEYETPMTSADPSPIRDKIPFELLPGPPRIVSGLDSNQSASEDEVPLAKHAENAKREQASSAVRTALSLLDGSGTAIRPASSNETSLGLNGEGVAVEDDNGDDEHTAQPSEDNELDDATPLVAASPAKLPKAFPFPRQPNISLSFARGTSLRYPSEMLQHCERNATPRQRRLLAGPFDRFIPNRAGTPTKEAFVLNKPAAKLTSLEKRHRCRDGDADPFGPNPRRSLRMAERFATLRSPAPTPRPIGRSATLVNDAESPRSISDGAVWTVGGTVVTEGVASTPNSRGGRVTSGTNAPHYIAGFLRKTTPTEEEATHARRLALAMDINQKARMLDHGSPLRYSPVVPESGTPTTPIRRLWRNGAWELDGPPSPSNPKEKKTKDIPIIPFRVLDAPALRDDYYCSLLAYSPTVHCLAVGLGPHVYLWSEARGDQPSNIPDSLTAPYAAHVTSISFSSREGESAILAIGRADGRITLWSPLDHDPRFDSEQPAPISCVSFRPTTVRRQSIREPGMSVSTEELLVGDEAGNIYFYSVEWPTQDQRDLFDWHGSMTLLARISCHSQQVCGIAWSPDGEFFATGGNDNQMLLFESKKLLSRRPESPRKTKDGKPEAAVNVRNGISSSTVAGQGEVVNILPGQEKHIFTLNAAVKAIAFAPWQPSLIAAGGGSNDRCIHFFHTTSGAKLATIDCHAQVTSLLWSERRKEIAATFGFAQPEHPYRVAVFSWPSCRMVVGIPWWSEERALYAVAYPRGPTGGGGGVSEKKGRGRVDAEGRPWYGKRTREEGCLVVATSDASIKFHEIWAEAKNGSGGRGATEGGGGLLGGSQILEGECSESIFRASVIR